jgi:hypothetical protein
VAAFPALASLVIGLLCIPGFICFFFCRCCKNCLGLGDQPAVTTRVRPKRPKISDTADQLLEGK